MKGKLGVVFSTVLLLSGVGLTHAGEADGAFDLVGDVLFGTYAPDDVQVKTLVPAAIGVSAGGALVAYSDRIADNPHVGQLLKHATLGQVKPQDMVEGFGLFTGVNGIMGLWKQGREMREKYAGSVGFLLMEEQVKHPGVVGHHEVRNAVVGGLAVMQGIPFLKSILPGLLGQLPKQG